MIRIVTQKEHEIRSILHEYRLRFRIPRIQITISNTTSRCKNAKSAAHIRVGGDHITQRVLLLYPCLLLQPLWIFSDLSRHVLGCMAFAGYFPRSLHYCPFSVHGRQSTTFRLYITPSSMPPNFHADENAPSAIEVEHKRHIGL